MNKTVIALVFLIIFKCISIHIHTFPRYNSFSFLIIECIYATLKHPRQQVQCWVMMLTFLLKLLMVRRSVVVFFLGCLFLFCFFLLQEFICKSKSVFFSPSPFPLFLPFLLDLELPCVEPTVRWARQYQLSVYAFPLMDCLTFFRGWTWSAWDAGTADGSWASGLNNSQPSSVSDMLQSAWWSKEQHCGSDMFHHSSRLISLLCKELVPVMCLVCKCSLWRIWKTLKV